MKKRIAVMALATFLLGSSCLEAKPFYKKKIFWISLGTSIAASAVATKEAHDCRQREGISFCSGGYGPFAAREAVRLGAAIGFNFLAAWGDSLGVKEAWALPIGNTIYNAYDAFDQTRKGCPAGQYPVYGTKYNCQPKDADDYDLAHANLKYAQLVHQ